MSNKYRDTDTVPAMLTPGEFVIRKEAVDAIGIDNLRKLNQLGKRKKLVNKLLRFKTGGVVPKSDLYEPVNQFQQVRDRIAQENSPYIGATANIGTHLINQLEAPIENFTPLMDRDSKHYKPFQQVGDYGDAIVTGKSTGRSDWRTGTSLPGTTSKRDFTNDSVQYHVPHSFVEEGGYGGILPSAGQQRTRGRMIGASDDQTAGGEHGYSALHDYRNVTPLDMVVSERTSTPDWSVDKTQSRGQEWTFPSNVEGREGEMVTEGGNYDQTRFKGKQDIATYLSKIPGLAGPINRLSQRLMEEEAFDSPMARFLNKRIGPRVTRVMRTDIE